MPPPLITVKHRLAVTEADGYDAASDVLAGAEADLDSCRQFVRAISAAGVLRVQVHARKGLLGYGNTDRSSTPMEGTSQGFGYSYSSATVANRHVPPLRHDVVHALAAEFPHLELVVNGGVSGAAAAAAHIARGAAGAMVGRAAVNHPCAALHNVDSDLYNRPSTMAAPSRGAVLAQYIAYAEAEELGPRRGRGGAAGADSPIAVYERLVAPPFNLFAGEEDCSQYHRKLRKLVAATRKRGDCDINGVLGAAATLRAAMAVLPEASLSRPVSEYVPLEALPVYDFGQRKVGSFQSKVW